VIVINPSSEVDLQDALGSLFRGMQSTFPHEDIIPPSPFVQALERPGPAAGFTTGSPRTGPSNIQTPGSAGDETVRIVITFG
jgi:hypothetical protein